ncbi:MAG: hypothetical protein LBL90_07215 [Prevotellaceae bacterium]|jgi:hypothetical protein|nr:hypothetical protein [Prevotellaceae bacterium]
MKNNNRDKKDIQKLIFEEIRKDLPSRFELARTVSKILKVSTDSVYRRIRGEKDISLKELIILCKHFNFSFDRYLQESTNVPSFYYPPLRYSTPENYVDYSQSLLRFLKSIWNIREKEFIMILSDIPLVHFTRYKELTLFKSFVSSHKMYEHGSFASYVEYAESMRVMNVLSELAKTYVLIPTTEIWSESTIDPTLRYLKLYLKAGYFEDVSAALAICNQLTLLVNHLEDWIERGYKNVDPETSAIKVYLSDHSFETDLFYLQSGPIKLNCFKLSTFNSLTSSDSVFCEDTEKFIEEQLSDSVLLNEVSKTDCTHFFNRMREKISLTIDFIKNFNVKKPV